VVAGFVVELLSQNPFDSEGKVPWIDFGSAGGGKVVALSQRQLAYLVANILVGNHISVRDGLSSMLSVCSQKQAGPKKLVPQAYLMSLLSFLAVLSQELYDGDQGRTLIAATPGSISDGWKNKLTTATLQPPTLCAKDAGGSDCGLPDYMSGGTEFQAVTSMAKEVVTGQSDMCDTSFNQDESLPLFYSEVLAFHFFTSESVKLPLPWTLLGARRYVRDISGQAGAGFPFYGLCGGVRLSNWLNEGIGQSSTDVSLGGEEDQLETVPSYAFVAVATEGAVGCKVSDAVQNNCIEQRNHLDMDMSLWFQAYEPTMYNSVVQDAFKQVISRIGTGPWGAGRAYGDSQQLFLAAWLATSVLGDGKVKLDYYIYSKFCENPGNQCYVLGKPECQACLVDSSGNQYPLPTSRCPKHSVLDMLFKFGGGTAWTLFEQLSTPGLSSNTSTQIFNYLAGIDAGNSVLKIKNPVPPNALGMVTHEKWSMEQGGAIKQPGEWCLDAPEPTTDGSALHLWECYENFPSQQWLFDPMTGRIKNSAGLFCLDTDDPGVDGSTLRVRPCEDNDDTIHQKWKVNSETGTIENEDGKCIDAPAPMKNGGLVHLWTCYDRLGSQSWIHKEVPHSMVLVRDWRGLCMGSNHHGRVSLTRCSDDEIDSQGWSWDRDNQLLMMSGKCLEAKKPHKLGTKVAMAKCEIDSDAQKWERNMTSGVFRNAAGMCLDAPEPDASSKSPLHEVHVYPCFDSLLNQQWAQDDKAGLVQNRHGYCLHAAMPSMKGSAVRMNECHKDLESQHWHLEEDTGLLKTQFGSCLASRNESLGSDLFVDECNTSLAVQKWEFHDHSGYLRHPGGLCIDTPEPKRNMGMIHLWTCFSDFPSQEWI